MTIILTLTTATHKSPTKYCKYNGDSVDIDETVSRSLCWQTENYAMFSSHRVVVVCSHGRVLKHLWQYI